MIPLPALAPVHGVFFGRNSVPVMRGTLDECTRFARGSGRCDWNIVEYVGGAYGWVLVEPAF